MKLSNYGECFELFGLPGMKFSVVFESKFADFAATMTSCIVISP